MGVPQGSALGPLLFSIFVNDIPRVLKFAKIVLYADDTALFFSSRNVDELENALNRDLSNIHQWYQMNKLTLNVSKTKSMLFGTHQLHSRRNNPVLSLYISGNPLSQMNVYKYLGVLLDSNLNFHEHISQVTAKVNQRLGMLKRHRSLLTFNIAHLLYKTTVLPLFDYCSVVYMSAPTTFTIDLQISQNKFACFCCSNQRDKMLQTYLKFSAGPT